VFDIAHVDLQHSDWSGAKTHATHCAFQGSWEIRRQRFFTSDLLGNSKCAVQLPNFRAIVSKGMRMARPAIETSASSTLSEERIQLTSKIIHLTKVRPLFHNGFVDEASTYFSFVWLLNESLEVACECPFLLMLAACVLGLVESVSLLVSRS
jgi:hypothetical protein